MMKNCCFCFNLITGAVILGWYGVVTYLFQLVLSIVCYFHIDYILQHAEPPKDITTEEWKMRLEIYIGCMFVIGLINLMASTMLIIGAVRENRYLLVPWLIGGAISILFTSISLMSSLITTMTVGSYIIAIIILAFQLYLWLCVLSLYQEIKERRFATISTSLLFDNGQTTSHYYQAI